MGWFPLGMAAGGSSFTAGWQDLRIGAGGQITDVSILSLTVAGKVGDGTILIRTDTGGGYIYEPTGTISPPNSSNSFASPAWRQLFTAASVPSSSLTYVRQSSGNQGVVEIVACVGTPNTAYAIWNGSVLVTTNLKSTGITWTDTTRTVSQSSNDSTLKGQGPYLYVDPNNPDICYYSTPSSGVFKTTNGTLGASSTWAQVTAVGTSGSNRGHLFAVDPASSVSGGVTQHFFIGTYGTGVYETTDGGANFTLRSTGGPTTFEHMFCDKFSQLWTVNNTTTASVFTTSWTTKTLPATGQSVAVDPTSAAIGSNTIVITRSGSGDVMISTDNGTNWNGPNFNQTFSSSGAQPGWLGTADLGGGGVACSLNTIGSAIDSSGKLWVASGVAPWTTPAPIAYNLTPWTPNAVGIEQLVCPRVISPIGVGPVVSAWDRGVVACSNPDLYPANQWPNASHSPNIDQIQGGWDVDSSGSFVAAWVWSNIAGDGAPAYSSDGGYTWTDWGATPASPTYAGAIAVNSATNWICVPGASRQIYYTTNGGGAWTASTITGSPTNWNTGIGQGTSLAPDRVTAGKFYAVNRQNSPVFFVSTNNGQNFTAASGTGMADVSPNLAFIKTPPGQADHVWYTVGGNGVLTSRRLWKSTNACANFSNVNGNMDICYNFGFGATKSGASYPTVYVWAEISGVLGYYQSTDGGSTWSAINAPSTQLVWAQSTTDYPLDISGDAEVYGRIYVTFSGTGAAYIDTADAYPWVKFDPTSVKPGQNLTGTVTLTARHSGLVPVTSVQFKVDGANIGAAQTGQSSYSVSWNTGGVATGAHTLSVVTTGANGTATSSLAITTS